MAGGAGFCWGVFAPAKFCATRFGAVATSPPLGCNGAGQAVFYPLPRINTLRRNTTPSLWGNAMGRRFYKRGAKKAWPLYATNRLCQHPTGMGRVAQAAAILKRGNPPAPLPGPATRPVAPQPRRRILTAPHPAGCYKGTAALCPHLPQAFYPFIRRAALPATSKTASAAAKAQKRCPPLLRRAPFISPSRERRVLICTGSPTS